METAFLCLMIATAGVHSIRMPQTARMLPPHAAPDRSEVFEDSSPLAFHPQDSNLAPSVAVIPGFMAGTASWYGEEHRGKLMANGKRFDPDRPTAASWFFPLGTRVRVSIQSQPSRNVIVTITDRGPAKRLVRHGRVIDLAQAAFERVAPPELGLVRVTIEPLESVR